MIFIKSQRELERMHEAGKIADKAMCAIEKEIRPGMSTLDIDAIARSVFSDCGAKPSFEGYNGFPAAICVSVNEEVVHGIPSKKRKLIDGDIVSVDLGAYIHGYHSDMARTFAVGSASEEVLQLIQVTKECFYKGMEQAVIGNHIADISQAVQEHAERVGYGVVRALVGHGLGQKLHEDPSIPNFVTKTRGPRLREGMTLAIEPMINLGTWDVNWMDDDWTVVTADGKPSAHYENTVAVTKEGPIILTTCEEH